MLDGDPLAHIIFVEIYSSLGKKNLIFSEETFTNNPGLNVAVLNSDAGANTETIINAKHWVNSAEGRVILCSGKIYK